MLFDCIRFPFSGVIKATVGVANRVNNVLAFFVVVGDIT